MAVISCHIHPDGDALGSALALHRALANAGRDAVVSFSEPFVVARHYRFLAGLDRLVPPKRCRWTPTCSLLRRRLARPPGQPGRRLPGGRPHRGRRPPRLQHPLRRRQPDRPGVAGQRRALPRAAPPPRPAARHRDRHRALHRAGHRHRALPVPGHHPETHHLAAELLAAGVRQYEVAKAVFETNDIAYLRLVADALGRIAQVPEASLVWTRVDLADLAANGVEMDETEGLIDLVRTDGASDVAACSRSSRRAATRSRCAPRGPPTSAGWPPRSAVGTSTPPATPPTPTPRRPCQPWSRSWSAWALA